MSQHDFGGGSDSNACTARSIISLAPHRSMPRRASMVREMARGQVIGATDKNGAAPSDRPLKVEDFACTLLAKLGIGVAIAARWIARTEIEAGQLIALPLPKAKLKRRWVVSTLKDRPLNLPERTFIGLCEEVGRRMIDVRH